MLSVLYPLLILVGLTIVGVMLFLWRQARVAAQLNLALIQLNESLHFDAPALLQQAWILLARGGVAGMHWKLNWFGALIEEQVGQLQGAKMEKQMHIGDMQLSICVWLSESGERRYFARNLVETFFLLLRTDMWIKSGTIDATLAQMAKLNLFLQHDMKNIAQFIQLMSDQLQEVPAEEEAQVLRYLRTAAPLVRQRADHIVQTLMLARELREEAQHLDLGRLFDSLCELHQLQFQRQGNAYVHAPPITLERAFDNIFKNYHDLHRRVSTDKASVNIQIAQSESSVEIAISGDRLDVKQDLERLFEPFWSSDPSGLGIGLYQAKSLLQGCRGELTARQNAVGVLSFCISFPLNA